MHWNFFYTLAGVSFLTSLVPVDGIMLPVGAVLTLTFHQLILSFGVFIARSMNFSCI